MSANIISSVHSAVVGVVVGSIFAIEIAVSGENVTVPGVVETEPDAAPHRAGPRRESVWRALDFGGEQRKIKQLTITLPERKATPWEAGIVGDTKLVYSTSDAQELAAVEWFLRWPLRIACAPGVHGCRGSTFTIGTIEVKTDIDTFTIGVTTWGFYLGDHPDYQTLFFSWGLAHYLDDVVFDKTGKHILEERLRNLSGECQIDEQEQRLSAWRKVKQEARHASVLNESNPAQTEVKED